jgi:ABC-type sugar transport system ATPase subunit
MNFISGQINATDGRVWFESGLVQTDLTHGPVPPTGSIVLGVRPEGVPVSRAESDGVAGTTAGWMAGRVTLTEVIAPDIYATVAVGDSSLRTRLSREDDEIAVGEEVRVSLIRSHLLFFDPSTGQRIDPSEGAMERSLPSKVAVG